MNLEQLAELWNKPENLPIRERVLQQAGFDPEFNCHWRFELFERRVQENLLEVYERLYQEICA